MIVLEYSVVVFLSDARGPSKGVSSGSVPSAVVSRQWDAIIEEAGAGLLVESVLIEPKLCEILLFTLCCTVDPFNYE